MARRKEEFLVNFKENRPADNWEAFKAQYAPREMNLKSTAQVANDLRSKV